MLITITVFVSMANGNMITITIYNYFLFDYLFHIPFAFTEHLC